MKFLTLQINLSVCSIYTSFFLFNVTFFSPSFIPFSFLSSVHYITQVRSYFVLALCWQLFMLLFFVRSQENQTKQKGACEIWSSHKAADENSCLLLCYAMSLHGGLPHFRKKVAPSPKIQVGSWLEMFKTTHQRHGTRSHLNSWGYIFF